MASRVCAVRVGLPAEGGCSMLDFLRRLLDSDFMPHGHCWRWEPWVVWTNVLPDAHIALCYLVIPAILVSLVLRRRDLAINRTMAMFGVFICACGLTHAMEVCNTWHGYFRLAGAL
jgi:two-component system, NtrC family, sensor kinase